MSLIAAISMTVKKRIVSLRAFRVMRPRVRHSKRAMATKTVEMKAEAHGLLRKSMMRAIWQKMPEGTRARNCFIVAVLGIS